jgi:hypothetical protein
LAGSWGFFRLVWGASLRNALVGRLKGAERNPVDEEWEERKEFPCIESENAGRQASLYCFQDFPLERGKRIKQMPCLSVPASLWFGEQLPASF